MTTGVTSTHLCFPYGRPLLTGQIKQQPADFRVTEVLGFEPGGSGEHLLLYVEKRGITTHQLIDMLARAVTIDRRRVGYAGLKDRQAVTRQWISLHLPGATAMPDIADTDEYRVVDARWHDRKLRIGTHRANQFEVRVRNLSGDLTQWQSVVSRISAQGFANYFGDQRFGASDNVSSALRALTHPRKGRRLGRQRRSLYLSALRSALFNRLLSARIEAGIWDAPVQGDLFMLQGTHSIFAAELEEAIGHRYRSLDIHSALPLYGSGARRATGEARRIEQTVFAEHASITDTLLQHELKLAYRAHRALAHRLDIDFSPASASMRIQVTLDTGVYLTTLLRHFIDCANEQRVST